MVKISLRDHFCHCSLYWGYYFLCFYTRVHLCLYLYGLNFSTFMDWSSINRDWTTLPLWIEVLSTWIELLYPYGLKFHPQRLISSILMDWNSIYRGLNFSTLMDWSSIYMDWTCLPSWTEVLSTWIELFYLYGLKFHLQGLNLSTFMDWSSSTGIEKWLQTKYFSISGMCPKISAKSELLCTSPLLMYLIDPKAHSYIKIEERRFTKLPIKPYLFMSEYPLYCSQNIYTLFSFLKTLSLSPFYHSFCYVSKTINTINYAPSLPISPDLCLEVFLIFYL